ncbi:MAG: YdjY domain-containing protein [Planctomycetaceae bacterium]
MRAIYSKLVSGLLGASFVFGTVFVSEVQGQLPATPKVKANETPVPVPDKGPDDEKKKPLPVLHEKLVAEMKGATPLNPEATVLLDVASSRIILRTDVACRDCLLEMLLVPEGNREHETILRIRSKAYVIHTGLLALGLEPGKPAEFSPAFVAPSGPEIDIEAVWVDDKGELQRKPVQSWIRRNIHRYYSAPLSGPPPGLKLPYSNLRWDRFNNEILWYGPMSDAERDDLLSKWDKEEYQQVIRRFHKDSQSIPMTAKFVFVGSSMYKDEETGEEYYQAEGGHVICTSNFGDALLDVKEESSASDGAQSYEGWTDQIPPKGTPALLMLKATEKKDGSAEKTPKADSQRPRK